MRIFKKWVFMEVNHFARSIYETERVPSGLGYVEGL